MHCGSSLKVCSENQSTTLQVSDLLQQYQKQSSDLIGELTKFSQTKPAVQALESIQPRAIAISVDSQKLLIWDAMEDGSLFKAFVLQSFFQVSGMSPIIESQCIRHILKPDGSESFVPISPSMVLAIHRELLSITDLPIRLERSLSAYKLTARSDRRSFVAARDFFIQHPHHLLTDKFGICEYSVDSILPLVPQLSTASFDQNSHDSAVENLLEIICNALNDLVSGNSIVETNILNDLADIESIQARCEACLHELIERSQSSASKTASTAISSTFGRIIKLWLNALKNDLQTRNSTWSHASDFLDIDATLVELITLSGKDIIVSSNNQEISQAIQLSQQSLQTHLNFMLTAIENFRKKMNESAIIPIASNINLIPQRLQEKLESVAIDPRLVQFLQSDILAAIWLRWSALTKSDFLYLEKTTNSNSARLYLLHSTLNAPKAQKSQLLSDVSLSSIADYDNQLSLLLLQNNLQ